MKSTCRSALRIILLFLAVWLLLEVWMWGIRRSFPVRAPSSSLYYSTAVEMNPWLEPWQRWDTPQYQAIAERGYSAFSTALFTPPLYPFLIRWTAFFFKMDSLAAGLLISAAACLVCLIAIFQTSRFEFKNEPDAWRAALYLAVFPTAFFLVAAYNESLFLLAAILCLYSARRHVWLAAGLWGAIAAITRTEGLILVFPLLFASWEASGLKDWRTWLAPTLTSLGVLVFPVYVWLGLGRSPLDILAAHSARGIHLAFPGWNLLEASLRILRGQLVEENLIELGFTILFIALTIFIWKKLPRIYGVYSVALMFLFITRLGSPQPLVSMARYVLEIFPAFLLLAVWGRSPKINRLLLYLSFLGFLFFSAQFAIWGWVG